MATLFKLALWIISISVLCTNVSTGADTVASEVPSEWKKVKEHDGITIYVQEWINKEKQPLARFRGMGRITVNDIYSLVAIMEDYEHYPDWLALLSSIEEINRDDYFNRYVRATVSFPIIQKRDFVAKASVTQDPKTESVTLTLKNKYDHVPLDPDYIRFPDFDGLLKFSIISATEVEVTYEIEAYIGGIATTYFTDYLLMFTPYLTIQNIREIVKNPKYHNLQTDKSEIQFRDRT